MDIPQPTRTLVIIIGASEWPKAPDLASSKAFNASANGLKQYFLESDLFGLPADNLLDLFDSDKAPSDIDEEISSFLEERLNTLRAASSNVNDVIVYYVGHGGFAGQNNEYFLAVRATRADNPLMSGILVAGLAKTLKEKMRSQRKFIILDACFSAAAYKMFQSAPMETVKKKTEEVFRKGTALLCSSGPRDPSKLPPEERHTMFTGALLDVLRKGTNEQGDRLSFADIGELAKNLIFDKYQDEAVRPQVLTPSQEQGNIATIPLFPNSAKRATVILERVEKLEAKVNQILSTELPVIRTNVKTLETRVDSVNSDISATINKEDASNEEDAALYRFGLTMSKWEALPGTVKLDIRSYRQERTAGLLWLFVSVLSSSILLSRWFLGTMNYSKMVMPLCLVIPIVSSFILWRDTRFAQESKSTRNEKPQEWEHWDIVVRARNLHTTHIFGGLQIWTGPFVAATAVYFLATLTWAWLRWFAFYQWPGLSG